MRIVICGVGAMGCLFGARLSPHADVRLLGHWAEQIQALRQAPLRIVQPDGTEERVKLHASSEPGQVATADVVLILTKTPKTQIAVEEAAQILKPDGVAITLQNGIGNWEILAAGVGTRRAVQGITMMGASVVQPGIIRVGGTGKTIFAKHDQAHNQILDVTAVFNHAGFPAEIMDDVRELVWRKLAVNAAINPLTAILRVPNGMLLDSQWASQLMREIAAEVEAVAAAQGIRLHDAARQAEQVAQSTALNRSSMLQDIQRGAETEIEAICGEVVRRGESTGIRTPLNAVLYALVKAMEPIHSTGTTDDANR